MHDVIGDTNDGALSVAIIPLNGGRLLTTERVRRAHRQGKDEARVPIRYGTFYSVCKAMLSGSRWLCINSTRDDINSYRQQYGVPIAKVRVVVETIFTYQRCMPPSISSWDAALPYINEGAALQLLGGGGPLVVPLLGRPYQDKDIRRRESITHSRKGLVLSYHLKQWASNWGLVPMRVDTDTSGQPLLLYQGSISPSNAVGLVTSDRVPNHSPRSYTTSDTLANIIALST